MIKVKAKDLNDHVGKYISVFRTDGTGSAAFMCKILKVNPDTHWISLRKITDATEEGERLEMYYKIADKVDVYDHDEAIILALKF